MQGSQDAQTSIFSITTPVTTQWMAQLFKWKTLPLHKFMCDATNTCSHI